ncbi:AraC family transcriptional regulator [Paenibacillus sepulcri]
MQTESFCWPFHQIVCCSQGEGIVNINKLPCRLISGTVFYIKPNVEHEYVASEQGYHVSWISFNGFLMDSLPALYGLPLHNSNTAIQDRNYPDIHLRVMSILEYIDSPFILERSSVALYGIVVEFFLQFKHKQLLNDCSRNRLIDKATAAFKAAVYDNMEIAKFAEELGVSRQHLSRLFRRRFQMTAKEYYMRLKVLQSKMDILQYPNESIKDIALRLGFVNASHFTKVFHSLVGASPTAFRQTYLNRRLLGDTDHYKVDVIGDMED